MEELREKNQMAIFEDQLAPFLKHNAYSKIERRDKLHYITKPWNNDSISFVLEPETQSDLIAALNGLILPPRFTAIYHLDTSTMEYIFTILEKTNPYLSRRFEFIVEGSAVQISQKS